MLVEEDEIKEDQNFPHFPLIEHIAMNANIY
jgi:hypothetical protein